jgi:hypothetical protein
LTGVIIVAAKWDLRAICVPSSDSDFAHAVNRAMASDRIQSRSQLEDALRAEYPDVRVRARELSGEPGITWYVYRDRAFPRQADEADR